MDEGNTTLGSTLLREEDDPLELGGAEERVEWEASSFSKAYVDRLDNNRGKVLMGWLLLFLVCGAIAPRFMEVVILVFDPPPGTPGDIATKEFNLEFPGQSRDWDALLLINHEHGKPLLEEYRNVTAAFISEVKKRVTEYGLHKAKPETEFVVADYFELESVGAMTLAGQLLDQSSNPYNATAMILSIHEVKGFEHGSIEGNKFMDWLDDELVEVRKAVNLPAPILVRVTGMISFCRDMQEATEKDMLKMDSLSFPIALAILCYMLQSARLLLIPIINIVIGCVVSFSIMYPVALVTRVIAVAPSVMMSVLVAFSIDYSLFLLSRYREEIIKGTEVKVAVTLMISSAGHTIAVSGATIAVCWFGLIAFPVTLLSTIGLGAGLTVITAFVVNVTLTPVLLLTFPTFFNSFEQLGLKGCCSRGACGTVSLAPTPAAADPASSAQRTTRRVSDSAPPGGLLLRRPSNVLLESPCAFDSFGRRTISPSAMPRNPNAATASGPMVATRTPVLSPDGTVYGEIRNEKLFGAVDPVAEIDFLAKNSQFYRIGTMLFGTSRRALLTTLAVCCAILPLAPSAVDFHHSESFVLFTPSDAESVVTALEMQRLYGSGRLAPYQLLIEPKNDTLVLSSKFFRHVQHVVENVIIGMDRSALEASGVSGLTMMNGHNISFWPEVGSPISLVGCAAKEAAPAVSKYFSVCAHAKCAPQIARCKSDLELPRCAVEIACLGTCSGDLACIGKCLAHFDEIDAAAWDLAKCAAEKCLVNPFDNLTVADMVTDVAVGVVDAAWHFAEEELFHHQWAAGALAEEQLPLPDCPSVLLQLLQSIRGFVPKSTWLSLDLNIDPYSSRGTKWLDSVRRVLQAQGDKDGYRYYLIGGDVSGHDVVNKVFELFPLIISIIVVAVFVLMGLTFRSFFIPLRAVFTIFLTLTLIYGMGVLVYEHGLLEWVGFHAWINPVGDSLCWLVPCMIAPVSVGLSLDYDIFSLDRIMEYRSAGFKSRDSILCGLAQTGNVITAAGLIMFFAFFGLSLSSNSALNQLSFFLCLSVLADCFVVRTLLVPSIMQLFGEWNWWPSRLATLEY